MKKIILVLIFTSLTSIALSSADSLYSEVIDYYSKIETFSSSLYQENYWQEIDVKKTSSGLLYYNEDSLLIAYEAPDSQKLYILNEDVLLYEPSSSQAVWLDREGFNVKPIEIMKDYWQKSEVEILQQIDDSTTIRLNSTEEEIIIELEKFFIRSVKISDFQKNSVKYRFQDEKINQSLPEDIFQPTFPEDTVYIDNRTRGN